MTTGRLTHAELAGLDALITLAQSRGRTHGERVYNTECLAEAQLAMHGGVEVSRHDREILDQIRQLAGQLEASPTLGQLLELRGQAVRADSSEGSSA